MIKIVRPATHAEWLELRKNGIGSSEVGTVLNVNPYETPYQLWMRKTGKVEPKSQNMAMKLGHYLEGAVAQLYEDETGNKVDHDTEGDWCAINDAKPYTMASPDRICTTPDGGKVLLECKTTRKDVDKDNIPMPWFCQVQYLLFCTGMEEGAIAWLKHGTEFGYKPIRANKEFQRFMLERIDRFWNDNVIADKAPAPTNTADLAMIYEKAEEGKAKESTGEIYETVVRLKERKAALKEIEGEIAEMEERVKMFMGDADTLTADGVTVCTWKSGKGAARFNRKRFECEHPELACQYIETGAPVRTFLIKKF